MRRHPDMRYPAPAPIGFMDWFYITLTTVVLLIIAAFFASVFLLVKPAGAKDKSQWANSPDHVREWYRTRRLTPEANKRFGFWSCCDHSDVVKTRFRVSAAGDEWWWLEGETWQRVPADIIHWGERTPTGEPILFAVGGKPTCFFPGGSDG